MSDAAITIIVAGLIQVSGMVVGFFTLWLKIRYSAGKAEEAATNAERVESKLDANTVTTDAVNVKTDAIAKQTDGNLERLNSLIANVVERVGKLEDYNRNSAHRVLDALNAVHLKVAELVALQPKPMILSRPPVEHKPS